MFFFYLTLFVSWWLTKVFWGEKAAKYSLFAIVPLGVLLFLPLWKDDVELSIVFSFLYAAIFVFINIVAFVVMLFRQADWKDPEFQRAFLEGLLNRRGGGSSSRSYDSDDEYGSYVIQYRSGSTWIDGPGSNDERVAESMFDRFLENDPRGSKRCRLVYKVNGRVQSVLSTN